MMFRSSSLAGLTLVVALLGSSIAVVAGAQTPSPDSLPPAQPDAEPTPGTPVEAPSPATADSVSAPTLSPAAGNGEIRGRILDGYSKHPVVFAEVALTGTGRHSMTNRDGRFAFPDISPGIYTLRVVRMGYEMALRDSVRVQGGEPVDLELAMTPKVMLLKTITVTPGTFSFMTSSTGAPQTMTREDIESVPQLGEDVFRAVNRLPGLSSGDYSAHFSIRGGRHDETLILLDGLELYEPYHLKDFNEGALSIVDVETIDGVQLMTGGFSAVYGNKRSGVFDITSRTPETDKARYSLGISFMNARAAARGPLWDGKGSWLASARSGFMDLVFGLIDQNELPSPRYHDFFGKFQVQLNPNHKLVVEGLYAGDTYKFDAPSTTGFQDSLKTREKAQNSYGNSYLWTTLTSTLGSKTVVKNLFSGSLVTRDRDGYERYYFGVVPVYSLKNNRDLSILGYKQDWTSELSNSYFLNYGLDLRALHTTDSFFSVVDKDPNDPSADPNAVYPVVTRSSITTSGTRFGIYLSNRVRVLNPLILELGGRYDQTTYTKDQDFSPRAGIALSLGKGRTLRTSWGLYRQMQGIDEVAALNNDNTYYKSELSEQWTVGLEQQFANGSLLRGEGYYKQGSHLRPVYRNWKNGIDTFPETNEDRILVYPTSTTSKGLEIYYLRRLNTRFSTRASYAYAIADEEVDRMVNVNTPDPLNYDKKHPIPQDQRHAANLDLTYLVRRTYSINGSFAFHTGWPGTIEALVPVVDEDGEPDTAVRPVKIYGERLPTYYRFDVRATRRWSTKHGDFRAFLELVNMTNHANVFGYDYFRKYDNTGNIVLDRDEETWFSILPSLGISWSSHF